jgi:hypothetical protein
MKIWVVVTQAGRSRRWRGRQIPICNQALSLNPITNLSVTDMLSTDFIHYFIKDW